VRAHDHNEPAAVDLVDPARPEQAIAAAAAACSNWGRWGSDDARGTLNFLTEIGKGWPYEMAQEDRLNAVTLEQVNAAWRKYVKPDGFVISTAGDFKGKEQAK